MPLYLACFVVLSQLPGPHPRSLELDGAVSLPGPPTARESAASPFDVVVNARGEDPPGRVQSETALAVDGDTMVAVWNDSAGFLGSEALTGVGVSFDGGRSWLDVGAVPQGADTDLMGDPAVVALGDGSFVIACVDLGNDDGIAVARLMPTPTGIVWDATRTFVRNGGEYLDKPALLATTSGAIALAYVNWSQNRGELARSLDGGITWTEPITIFESSRANGIALAEGQGGKIHVVWTDPIGEGGGTLWSRRLHGADWASPRVAITTLGPHSHDPPRGFDRTVGPTFAALAVDRSTGPHRGRVYVAWSDGESGHFDTWVASSSTGGDNWATPVRVNDNDEPTEAFWPRVAVGVDGRLSALWYDRRRDLTDVSACDVMVAQSIDGGVTFGPNRRLSNVAAPWEGVPADMVPNFGDYLAHALDAHAAYGLWSDARAGDPDVVFGRVDDVVTMDVVGAGTGGGVAWRVAGATSLGLGAALGGPELLAALAQVLVGWPVESDGLWDPGVARIIAAIDVDAAGGRLAGVGSLSTTDATAVSLELDETVNTLSIDLGDVLSLRLAGSILPRPGGGADIFGQLALHTTTDTIPASIGVLVAYPDDPGRGPGKPIDVQAEGRRRVTPSDWLTTWVLTSEGLGDAPPPLATAPEVPILSVGVDPNPSREHASVVVTTDRSIEAKLGVYTTAGQRVRMMFDGFLQTGTHRVPFDRSEPDGRRLAPGVYFVRLSTPAFTAHGKMVLVGR